MLGGLINGLSFAYKAYANFYRVQNAINTVNEVSKIGNLTNGINPQSILSMSETKGVVPDQALNLAGTVGSRVTEVATNLSKSLDTAPIKSGIDNVKSNVGNLIDDNKGTFEKGIDELKDISEKTGVDEKIKEYSENFKAFRERFKPIVESNIKKFDENPTLKQLVEIKSKTNNRIESLKNQVLNNNNIKDLKSQILSSNKNVNNISNLGPDLSKFSNSDSIIGDIEKQSENFNYKPEDIYNGDLNSLNFTGIEIPKVDVPDVKITDLNIKIPEIPKVDAASAKPNIDMEGVLNEFYNFKLLKK